MGKASREIGGTLQTDREGKQTRRSYSIPGVNARRYGTTFVHRQVQTNYRRTWMARGRQRHSKLLGLKIQWCIRNVWKGTRIRLQPTGSSKLPQTSTIAIVKDRLCRLAVQHRQQPQPYKRGQLNITSYNKIIEKMENQERALPEVWQKQERKIMQEQKFQTKSSAWLADKTGGQK